MTNKEEQCSCEWLTSPPKSRDTCSRRIACIPLDEIAIPKIWSPARIEKIRKWATKQNLTSAEIAVEIFGDTRV